MNGKRKVEVRGGQQPPSFGLWRAKGFMVHGSWFMVHGSWFWMAS